MDFLALVDEPVKEKETYSIIIHSCQFTDIKEKETMTYIVKTNYGHVSIQAQILEMYVKTLV